MKWGADHAWPLRQATEHSTALRQSRTEDVMVEFFTLRRSNGFNKRPTGEGLQQYECPCHLPAANPGPHEADAEPAGAGHRSHVSTKGDRDLTSLSLART